MRIARALAATLFAVTLASQPAWAGARHDRSTLAVAVTLSADPASVLSGESVTLSGSTDPATAAETVEIRGSGDALVAAATTRGDGTFRTSFVPAGSLTLHAVWLSVESSPVDVSVRAIVSVHLSNVRLFDIAVANGTAAPVRPGAAVIVQLLHAGKIVATRSLVQDSAGAFRTTFKIMDPGAFRARATFSAADLSEGSDTTDRRTTPLPDLHEGSSSDFVELVERRLVALHYYLTRVNDSFDFRTGDAVLAFRKVQGMTRTKTVTSLVWRALAHPRSLPLVSTSRGFHIEIDQTRQVLVTVRGGQVRAIIHVSTGKPSTPTPDGNFRIYRKIAGYSPHLLYYPSYFDGNRAIHGWPDVPSYAASHGCTRVPYWAAKWIYGLAKIGTKVIIHH